MTQETIPERSYRGMTSEERRAQRREQLIKAAINVYGETGYRQATIKAVCAAAGLTERYFYESFGNSEELLVASFQIVTQQMHRALSAVGHAPHPSRMHRVSAMLHAYFSTLKQDPKSARVFLVEIRGVSPAMDAAFEASVSTLGDGLARATGRQGAGKSLLSAGVAGGVIQIALCWIANGYRPSLKSVVDSAAELVMVMADRQES
ncbi:TetR/AcrR family transcriptional regulator [Noviherbaspirillum galbum]|nr:TetR/AcrR family transcriptional regulator [Noviherbaspirillum galbum]